MELPQSDSVEKVHKVLLGIPLKGHTPPVSYHDRMLMFLALGHKETEDFYEKRNPRYTFAFDAVGEMFIPYAREEMAKHALDLGCDYLFMIDDDMLCPPDLFFKLVAHDKDIVSALAFTRNPPHVPVIYAAIEGFDKVSGGEYFRNVPVKNYPKNSLVECDATGFGAVLIKTDVFRKMKAPWFMGTAGSGEDISFCYKAKKLGFRVFMDTSIKLGHVSNPIIVTEAYSESYNKLSDAEREKFYGQYQKYETHEIVCPR